MRRLCNHPLFSFTTKHQKEWTTLILRLQEYITSVYIEGYRNRWWTTWSARAGRRRRVCRRCWGSRQALWRWPPPRVLRDTDRTSYACSDCPSSLFPSPKDCRSPKMLVTIATRIRNCYKYVRQESRKRWDELLTLGRLSHVCDKSK